MTTVYFVSEVCWLGDSVQLCKVVLSFSCSERRYSVSSGGLRKQ